MTTWNITKTYPPGKFYPDAMHVYKIFDNLELKDIKVVILGLDPYPQENIADGYAFSFSCKEKIPASLRVILAEMKRTNPDLSSLVKQGVFLLNSALTVNAELPVSKRSGSHRLFWRDFTRYILQRIYDYDSSIIFVGFGRTAEKFISDINGSPISFITAHPSPNATKVKRPFRGSGVFESINDVLSFMNKSNIHWGL